MIFLLIGLAALSSFLVFDNDEINSDILAAFAQTNSEKDQVMSKEFITFYDTVNHTLTTIPSDTVNHTLTTIPSDTVNHTLILSENISIHDDVNEFFSQSDSNSISNAFDESISSLQQLPSDSVKNHEIQKGHDKDKDKDKDKKMPTRHKEKDRNLHESKIHPKLMKIFNDKTPKAKAKLMGTTLRDDIHGNDVLDVYVYMKPEHAKEKPNNIDILARDKNIILSSLSLEEIQLLSSQDSVERITLPERIVPRGHIQSEGVSFTFADKMHQSGITGNGVDVAVMDLGFIATDPEISSHIISTFVGPTCSGDLACGTGLTNSHGTAVAEIIVDMAPGVDLRLYSVTNSVELNIAIDNAISLEVDIITMSLGLPGTGGNGTTGDFRDGTSSVALKVDEAKAAGILVTVAAGNQGDSHWQGTYVANSTNMPEPFNTRLNTANGGFGYQSVMIFNDTEPDVAMKACLPVTNAGDPFIASWNAWATTNQDYDIWLAYSNMTDIHPFGLPIDQSGFASAPLESLTTPLLGDACLVLASFSSTEDHFFHIDTEGNGLDPSFQISSGSIDTPADARGALSVGAVDHSTDLLEAFSSQGPTDDARIKPEICGHDKTFTHQTTLNPSVPGTFPGTSASTPHVAGAAALLLEQNPSLTVNQLQDKLINEAKNGNYSIDNQCGSNSGVVSLLISSGACTPPSTGDWTVTDSCTMPASAIAPGNVIVQNNSVLTVPSGITLDIDFENNNLTVKSGSGVLVESGGKIT